MPPRDRPLYYRWIAPLLVCLVCVFYLWTGSSRWPSDRGKAADADYYNLLTRGFIKGHLYLDKPADPFLTGLADPTDPQQRQGHGLFDASYRHGRYYLYWGVTPVVVLFLPFRLVTGHYLGESQATAVFAILGFLASVWILRSACRRYFPTASTAAQAAAVIALGLASVVPASVRLGSTYECVICCGYACAMTGLGALFEALQARRKWGWFLLAGTAFGLAVGSRPVYLFSCPAVVAALFLAGGEARLSLRLWRNRPWRGWALAAILPPVLIGLLLAAYNLARFGSVTEFGLRYQLTGVAIDHVHQFRWSFLPYNLRLYGWGPARWSPYFPFVRPTDLGSLPAGNLGYDDPFGVPINLPIVLAAFGLLVPSARRLRGFAFIVAMTAAGTGFALLAFGSASARYMIDFTPALLLLGALGTLALDAESRIGRRAHAGVKALTCAVLAVSAAFGVGLSFGHRDFFRNTDPAGYHRTAKLLDRIPWAWDWLAGVRYGPLELKLMLPKHPGLETLVATGEQEFSDFISLRTIDDHHYQFEFIHNGRGTFESEVLTLDPKIPHTLRIDLGSLYPPAEHPYFRGLTNEEAALRRETVRVTCDEHIALDVRVGAYDAVSRAPAIGTGGSLPAPGQRFSGMLLSQKRLAHATLSASRPLELGAARLWVRFAPFTGVRSEPLLSTGEAGRGDLIYVHYVGPGRVQIGHDHWSMAGQLSQEIAIDPGAEQTVEIDAPALHSQAPDEREAAAEGHLLIRVNGKAVLDEDVPYYAAAPRTVSFGYNAIGASTAQAQFSGTLLRHERFGAR